MVSAVLGLFWSTSPEINSCDSSKLQSTESRRKVQQQQRDALAKPPSTRTRSSPRCKSMYHYRVRSPRLPCPKLSRGTLDTPVQMSVREYVELTNLDFGLRGRNVHLASIAAPSGHIEPPRPTHQRTCHHAQVLPREPNLDSKPKSVADEAAAPTSGNSTSSSDANGGGVGDLQPAAATIALPRRPGVMFINTSHVPGIMNSVMIRGLFVVTHLLPTV
jgi:hypothetical protein